MTHSREEELFKKYLTDTVSKMTDEDSSVNNSSPNRSSRALPRTSPLSKEEILTNRQYARDRAAEAGTRSFGRNNSGEYPYDAKPDPRYSEAGRRFFGTNMVNNTKMGPFFYDMNAGTFGIGGVEFDFRSLDRSRETVNEALLILVTELLLFINDIKSDDKYKTALDEYVSQVDTLPQSALRDVSLPVIDTTWSYPGPVYMEKRLPLSYKLKDKNSEIYCGNCYNYVGGNKVGKCHRWNNAVSAHYKCTSFKNRTATFSDDTYKGRFRSTDEAGNPIIYSAGDVVTFNSRTYVATQKTSAAVGTPIHSNTGWKPIDQNILDGGEF